MTTPTVHRGRAAVAMPWKNGGGSTRELARHPVARTPAAGEFDWRLSVADVAASGPFSEFPGVDRILVLLSGAGMDLSFDDGTVASLRPEYGAHCFAGERRVEASLVHGPTTDLNLMVRRGRWSAAFVRHDGPARVEADLVLAYVAEGTIVLSDGGTASAGDAIECPGALEWTGDAEVLVFLLGAHPGVQ